VPLSEERWRANSPAKHTSQSRNKPLKHAFLTLSEADCQNVWELASPGGNVEVFEDKAEPFVLNFQMVDSDNDAKIDESEFKPGCSKGWIKSADAATIKDMEGTPADKDKM
jgi:hypothetical protein